MLLAELTWGSAGLQTADCRLPRNLQTGAVFQAQDMLG